MIQDIAGLLEPVIQAALKLLKLKDWRWPSYFLQRAQSKDARCTLSRSISQRSQESVWCSRSCSLCHLLKVTLVTCRFAFLLELALAGSCLQRFRPVIFVRLSYAWTDITRKRPDICPLTGRYNWLCKVTQMYYTCLVLFIEKIAITYWHCKCDVDMFCSFSSSVKVTQMYYTCLVLFIEKIAITYWHCKCDVDMFCSFSSSVALRVGCMQPIVLRHANLFAKTAKRPLL